MFLDALFTTLSILNKAMNSSAILSCSRLKNSARKSLGIVTFIAVSIMLGSFLPDLLLTKLFFGLSSLEFIDRLKAWR